VLETEARVRQVLGSGDYGGLRRMLDRVIEAYK
jgi:hypothetical protein